jgi:hypothetical protein
VAGTIARPDHPLLVEGSNVGEIWARFQRGEIFKKTCSLVIINNRVHLEGRRQLQDYFPEQYFLAHSTTLQLCKQKTLYFNLP